jgi:hypothetical protein
VRSVSFRPRAPHSLRLQEVPSPKASFKRARLIAVIAIAAVKSKAFEFPLMNQSLPKRAFCLEDAALR